MGKCSKCGKKILYNRYVIYEGQVFCMPCRAAQLSKEAIDKEKAKAERAMKKLVKPSKKAKKAMEDKGVDSTPAFTKTNDMNEEDADND